MKYKYPFITVQNVKRITIFNTEEISLFSYVQRRALKKITVFKTKRIVLFRDVSFPQFCFSQNSNCSFNDTTFISWEKSIWKKKKKRRQENRSAFWRSLLSVSQTSGKQTKEWKQQRTQKWQTFPMVLQQHFSWRHEEGLFWTFYHRGLFWARDICAPYVQNTGQMEVMSFSGCIKLCTLLKKNYLKGGGEGHGVCWTAEVFQLKVILAANIPVYSVVSKGLLYSSVQIRQYCSIWLIL